jgi:hypothetical protein
VDIIKNPFQENLLEQTKLSTSNVILCAPYVKQDLITKILINKPYKTTLSLITKISLANFASKASDIEAIEKVITTNNKAFNKSDLHAKIYSFDDRKAIITSGNLSYSGTVSNFEYGVGVDNQELIKEIHRDLNEIIENSDTSTITMQTLHDMKKLIMDFKIQNNVIFVNGEDGAITTSLVDKIKDNSTLTQWQKNLLNLILNIKTQTFELSDLYQLKTLLQTYYPNNNTIESSIRRNLQELRDLGLIQFYGNGKYRKLWM